METSSCELLEKCAVPTINIFAPCDVVNIVQVSGSSGFSISGRPDPVGGSFNADFPDG